VRRGRDDRERKRERKESAHSGPARRERCNDERVPDPFLPPLQWASAFSFSSRRQPHVHYRSFDFEDAPRLHIKRRARQLGTSGLLTLPSSASSTALGHEGRLQGVPSGPRTRYDRGVLRALRALRISPVPVRTSFRIEPSRAAVLSSFRDQPVRCLRQAQDRPLPTDSRGPPRYDGWPSGHRSVATSILQVGAPSSSGARHGRRRVNTVVRAGRTPGCKRFTWPALFSRPRQAGASHVFA
jgi:hypothetical protein